MGAYRDAAVASQTIAPEEPTQHELAGTDDPKLARILSVAARASQRPVGGLRPLWPVC